MKLLSLVFSFYIVCLVSAPAIGSASQEDTPVVALGKYLQLRFHDADWKEYSKLITWPDEPSWDCKWVDEGYKIGTGKKMQDRVVIPVTHNRIGLYCYNDTFRIDQRVVIINYELVSQNNQWRIKGPEIDYPEIGVKTLVEKLRTSKTAADVLKKIESAMNRNK
jgi:hypothetical protein